MRFSLSIALLPLALAAPTKRQLDNLVGGATNTGGSDLLSGFTGGSATPATSGESTSAGGAGGAGGLDTLFSGLSAAGAGPGTAGTSSASGEDLLSELTAATS